MNIQSDLKDIQIEKNKLSEQVQQYLDECDRSVLARSLKNSKKQGTDELIEQSYTDQDYANQLDVCNKLWYLWGLINELKPLRDDPQSIDFGSAVKSYCKLKVQLDDIKTSLHLQNSYIRIFDQLDKTLKEYRAKIVDLVGIYIKEYIQFTPNLDLHFQRTVKEMEFSQFLISCHQFTVSEDMDSSALFNFNKMFNGWAGDVLTRLEKGGKFTFAGSAECLDVKIEDCGYSFGGQMDSIEKMIEFFNELVKFNSIDASYDPFVNIRAVVGKTLLKRLKATIFSDKNVYPLILSHLKPGDTQNVASKQLNKISQLLSQPGWSKDGLCELEFWMDDLVSTWINGLMSGSIDKVKRVVLDMRSGKYKKAWSQLEEETVKDQGKETTKEKGEKKGDSWDDEWEEDWNGDEEKDEDKEEKKDEKNQDKKQDKKEDKDQEDEDGWDDWDDGWNDDEKSQKNEEIPKKATKSPSKPERHTTIRYSIIAEKIVEILGDYYSSYETLSKQIGNQDEDGTLEDEFQAGFKKLLTSFFMMTNSDPTKFYPSIVLFYNDFNRIIQQISVRYQVDLSGCFDMSGGIIDRFTNEEVSNPSNLVSKYSGYLFDDGFENSTVRTQKKDEFLGELNTEFTKLKRDFDPQKDYNEQLVTGLYLTASNQTFEAVCSRLVKRQDIASDECDILGEIIDKMADICIHLSPGIDVSIHRMQSYNKLIQIRQVIVSNLKTIMDAFYDAKLFELDTSELIGLIKASFIDSEKRRDAIDRIIAVRNA